MKRFKSILLGSRRRKLVTVVLLALIASSVAYAAWSWTTTGAPRSKVGTAQQPTVSTPATFSGIVLFPGALGDVQIAVTNPNPYAITLNSYQRTGAAPSSANCNAVNFTGPLAGLATTTLGTPISIAANASAVIVTLPNSLGLAASAPQTCAGEDIVFGAGSVTFNLST